MKKKHYLSALLCAALMTPNAYAQCPAGAPSPLAVPACSGTAVTSSYTGQTGGTYYSTGSVTISGANVFIDGGTLVVCSGKLTIERSNLFLNWGPGGASSATPVNIIVNSGATLDLVGANTSAVHLYKNVNITNYGTINFGGLVEFVAPTSNSAIINQGTITGTGNFTIDGTDNGIINNGTMSASAITYNATSSNAYTCLGSNATLNVTNLTNAGSSHPFFTASGSACVKLSGTYTPGGTGNVVSNSNSVKVCSSSATAPTAADAGAAVVTYSCSNCSVIALPIVLKNFVATSADESININFTTADEKNISSFDVEKSNDANNFVRIGRVAAKNIADANYSLADHSPFAGINYYRLRVNLAEGTSVVSGIASASIVDKSRNELNIYPNPANDKLHISGSKGSVQITIIDALGRKYLNKNYDSNKEQAIDISALVPGIYLIRVQMPTHTKTMQFTKLGQQ